MSSQRVGGFILLASLFLAAGSLAAEEITPIASLLKNKAAFDRKFCCVAGKTSTLFTKVSRHAHPYFTIWVSEGEDKVKVFGYGKPPFVEGEKIEACGVFSQEYHHSSRIFYDQISAKVILRGDEIGKGKVELTPTDAHLIATKP
jgi:hypothetical protein